MRELSTDIDWKLAKGQKPKSGLFSEHLEVTGGAPYGFPVGAVLNTLTNGLGKGMDSEVAKFAQRQIPSVPSVIPRVLLGRMGCRAAREVHW